CSVLVLTLTLLAAGGVATAKRAADTVYRVRPDPRMCPSPICGGFWATRLNVSPTSCFDGSTPPACYVAALGLTGFATEQQDRIRRALTQSRALIGGSIVHYPSDRFPQLGSLRARRAWLAAGSASGSGIVYRVVDTGIKCIRAPCFSFRATVVNDTRSLK